VSEPEYLGFMAQNPSDRKRPVDLVLANGSLHKDKGVIETVESEFNSETGCIPFRAEFPNPELLLKNGETGKVRMTLPIQSATIIPQKATYELQDRTYVYVLDAKNTVHSREVVIKYKLPNVYILESGLKREDRFLVEGIQMVNDDDKVVPVLKSVSEIIGTSAK
jgi:membrane fusion protein (multidrug efflux system)